MTMVNGTVWLIPLAFALDLALGDPRVGWHPVCLAGWWCRKVECFWKRMFGKTFLSGGMAWFCSVLPWLFLCFCLLSACRRLFPSEWGVLVPGAMAVYACLAPRSLAEHAWRVIREASSGDLERARRAVSMIVGRDTEKLDMHGVLRAAIESVAENWTDGVFSTIFWVALGCTFGGIEAGALCAVFHRVSNIMDAMWGKRNDEYRRFGTWAARTDDVLNWIPARLSLPLVAVAAAVVPGCSLHGALSIGWKYRHQHASPNSAWSEAAFAGALGLRLSGPVSYKGMPAPYPYIGEGRTEATVEDARHAVLLMAAATVLAIAVSVLVLQW